MQNIYLNMKKKNMKSIWILKKQLVVFCLSVYIVSFRWSFFFEGRKRFWQFLWIEFLNYG